MEGWNWSMYGLKIDVTELMVQSTYGAQYTLYVMCNRYGLSIRVTDLPCEQK